MLCFAHMSRYVNEIMWYLYFSGAFQVNTVNVLMEFLLFIRFTPRMVLEMLCKFITVAFSEGTYWIVFLYYVGYIVLSFRQQHFVSLGSPLKNIRSYPTRLSQEQRYKEMVGSKNCQWTQNKH